MSTTTTALSSSYKLEKLHPNTTRNDSYSSVRCACSSVSWISTRPSLYLSPVKRSRGRRSDANPTVMMDLNGLNDLSQQLPIPSGFPDWSKWMPLTVIPMILPLFKSKWGPLIMLKRQLDTTFGTVETMSEVIEQVAVKVDELADEMVENLPEGSKLRNAIEMIDDVAEETIKAADCVQDLLQKVDDLEDKLEKAIEDQVAGGGNTESA